MSDSVQNKTGLPAGFRFGPRVKLYCEKMKFGKRGVCSDCARIQAKFVNKTKKCLSCDGPFVPICSAPFVCSPCRIANASRVGVGEYHLAPRGHGRPHAE